MTKIINYDLPRLEQINTPNGRKYKLPDGTLLPSVTTVLSSIPNEHIEQWKAKVGEEKAKQISEAAAKRGTKIHTWCECFIKQIGFGISPLDFETGNMFRAMIPELRKFDEVHALETKLFSTKLRVAGTVDCIAKIDGKFYVVDFKTSSRFKTRDDIPSYFMQASVYAMAWYELTGISIEDIRIIITTQDDGVLVYDEKVRDWLPEFVKVRKQYDLLLL